MQTQTKIRLVELYQSGLTLLETGKEIGVTPDTVQYWLKKFGIPRRKKGRPVLDMTPQERVLANHPGIDKEIGDVSVSMREIGEKHGVCRERIRQFERIFGFIPRQEIRGELAEMRKANRKIEQQERKKARKQRWADIANQITLLINSGASRDRVIAAMPWSLANGSKVPLNQRLSVYLCKLRTLSGVLIPKPHFFFGGGVPVGTKRK